MKIIRLNTTMEHRRWFPKEDFIAFVDDEDYSMISQFNWSVNRRKNHIYAQSKTGLMHRLVLDAPPGTHTHHKDGNGLNNTRANLVIMSMERHLLVHRLMKSVPLTVS